jgi:polysaccharide biosynthesis/export protein
LEMSGAKNWRVVSCVVGLFLNSMVPAAAQQENSPGKIESAPVSTSLGLQSDSAQRPVPAERNPRYKIASDDVLTISFPLTPELNQKVTVQPDGYISLQSSGNIHVAGLTVPALVEVIKKAYANVLHDPIVDVDLTDFQKPFFTVLGQVEKPGEYDLRRDTTVTQAIAVAGGFVSASAKTQVFLYRAVSANWAEVRELKLKDILKGKNISEDVHLRPGDMIFVPENFISNFKRYVPYSVGLVPPYPSSF